MKAAAPRRGELLGPVLQRYFCDYLINQRRLSDCTVAAYRDTFKLLLALSVRDAQAANIWVELDFDHPILAAPEIVVPEMLYSPPCPI
jgi:hypothetical protein